MRKARCGPCLCTIIPQLSVGATGPAMLPFLGWPHRRRACQSAWPKTASHRQTLATHQEIRSRAVSLTRGRPAPVPRRLRSQLSRTGRRPTSQPPKEALPPQRAGGRKVSSQAGASARAPSSSRLLPPPPPSSPARTRQGAPSRATLLRGSETEGWMVRLHPTEPRNASPCPTTCPIRCCTDAPLEDRR